MKPTRTSRLAAPVLLAAVAGSVPTATTAVAQSSGPKAQPRALPERIQAIAHNVAQNFVAKVMRRLNIGDASVGAALVSDVRTTITGYSVDENGDYATSVDLRWNTIVTGRTGFRATLLVLVNPKDNSWLVIPKGLDENANMLINLTDFTQSALVSLADETETWNTPESALQMFRGKVPAAPTPASVAADLVNPSGPSLVPGSSDRVYEIKGSEVRVNFFSARAGTLPSGDNQLPSWGAFKAAVSAAGGDLHRLGDGWVGFDLPRGATVAIKWSKGTQLGFMALHRKPDGTLWAASNEDDKPWTLIRPGQPKEMVWEVAPGVRFRSEATEGGGSKIAYRLNLVGG